jgi:hypothetical protein
MREVDPHTVDAHRRRTRVVAVAVIASLLVVGGGIAAVLLTSGDDSTRAPAHQRALAPVTTAPATTTTMPPPPPPPPLRAAATKGIGIPVFASPDPASAPVDTLSARTSYNFPRTLLALGQQQDWLQVSLPTRPNNSVGWVKVSDVEVSAPLEWSVRINLAEHHLWLAHNGVDEFDTGVAIGTPQYPTPTGLFYVTDPIDLHDQPNLGYGVFAIGLSGHSDVLTDFGGGDGQIGIHGTNNPGDIGRDVSHGCVRLTNDAIERLAQLPLGTPVWIQ